MAYSGTGDVTLEKCTFDHVKWEFFGPAQGTLNFLRNIYHGMGPGGKILVESTFDNIRRS